MKKHNFLFAFVMAVVLPYLLFTLLEGRGRPMQNTDESKSQLCGYTQYIHVMDGDRVISMELDAYITGVVLGEMPADFEMEALKAQAVAARTYTLRNVLRNSKHPDADVCTDSTCCQAFMHVSEYPGGEKNLQKVRQAVTDTSCQVITYQGNLIEATYFSCSGGKTEDAIAVWGTNVPYLKSVSSPGEEDANFYESQYLFSKSEFLSKLGLAETCQLSESNIMLIYTEGNGVQTMTVDGNSFAGTQVRTLLSLPSTSFTVKITDIGVLVETKGNGHRVGMSQYGADAMAIAGKTYDEILTHYYSGTVLETFSQERMNAIFDKEANL